MQLPFIHIHTYIFNRLSFVHLIISPHKCKQKTVETWGKLLYNKYSKDKHIYKQNYERLLCFWLSLTLEYRMFSLTLSEVCFLCIRQAYFNLVEETDWQYLTIQSRLQWSYSSHSSDSPYMSSRWHIQLCNLRVTVFYS